MPIMHSWWGLTSGFKFGHVGAQTRMRYCSAPPDHMTTLSALSKLAAADRKPIAAAASLCSVYSRGLEE